MLFNTRKFLLGFIFTLSLLPMLAFASAEFKGTETVNINKANAATLAAYLKGIGPNKAEAIVKFRKSNGSFKSAADIQNVPGVGEKTYKDIKSKISTSRGKSVAPKGYKIGETSGKSTSSKKSSSKKSSSKKSTAESKSSSSKEKSSASKSKSSKSKKSLASKKTSKDKATSSKAKKATSAKKKSTAKKSTKAKKTATTKKKASTAKKTTSKKKKTVKCKKGQKKVKGKCKAA